MGIYLDTAKASELHRTRSAVRGFADALSGSLFQNEYDEYSCEFNVLKMARVLMEAVSDAVIWDDCEKA